MKYSSRAVVILIFFERNNVHCKTFFHRYIYFRKLNMVLTTKVNMTSLILIWLFLLLLLELENKSEQSDDDGKIWKRNILFWITFGVQFFKWKARKKMVCLLFSFEILHIISFCHILIPEHFSCKNRDHKN